MKTANLSDSNVIQHAKCKMLFLRWNREKQQLEASKLTLTPVHSLQAQTKRGDRPDTIRTLVKRLFITAGWSLRTGNRGLNLPHQEYRHNQLNISPRLLP